MIFLLRAVPELPPHPFAIIGKDQFLVQDERVSSCLPFAFSGHIVFFFLMLCLNPLPFAIIGKDQFLVPDKMLSSFCFPCYLSSYSCCACTPSPFTVTGKGNCLPSSFSVRLYPSSRIIHVLWLETPAYAWVMKTRQIPHNSAKFKVIFHSQNCVFINILPVICKSEPAVKVV